MKSLHKFLKDKKGSGIMTVMLAVLFLTAFGSLALYLTYTSFQVATSDRYSKEVTYNANTCMEEVKAGVQDIVSEAIEETYRDVMPDYIRNAADISALFAKNYFSHIVEAGGDNPDNRIINQGTIHEQTAINTETNESYSFYSNGTYNPTAIENLIKEKRGYTCTVSSTSGNLAEVLYDAADTQKTNPLGIVLRGIKVTFTGRAGRKSAVTADIKIGVPNIGYLLTQYAIQGIPEFTFVCNGTMRQTNVSGLTNGATVSGSAYAGAVELGNNTRFSITDNSTFICKGNIKVNGGNATNSERENNPRFMVSANSTLWTKNIEIGPYSSVRLLGTTRVANDLVFNGNDSYADLRGRYYGFGCSETDPARSSSIISNRKGAIINMEFLEQMTLAGFSFITNEDRVGEIDDLGAGLDSTIFSGSGAIRMGESLSGKLNQKLYIAPYGSVSGYKKVVLSNGDEVNYNGHYIETDENGVHKYYELIVQGEGEDATQVKHYLPDEEYRPQYNEYALEPGESKVTILSKDEFFSIHHFAFNSETIPELNRPYTYYGIELKPVYRWYDNDTVIVYFFLSFDTQEHANQYFIDYFNASINGGSDNVSEMLFSYLNAVNKNGRGIRNLLHNTAGAFYTDIADIHDGKGHFTTPVTLSTTEIEALAADAVFVESVFDNYCKTLTNVEVQTDAANPFEYYINTAKIDSVLEPNERKFFYTRDKLTGVVSNGDFTFNGANPDLCLIVANGDVTVTADFNGLIICSGDIIINSKANFTNSSENVLAAFVGDTAPDVKVGSRYERVVGDYQLKEFFNIDILEQYQESESSSGDAWNVAALVTFAKWNRE